MKFSDFKEQEKVRVKTTVVNHLSNLPHHETWGGRQVIRDDSCAPWEADWLDQKFCLECCGELAVIQSPASSSNILYYTCTKHIEHKFVRVLPNKQSGIAKLFNAATSVLTGQPLDDDLDKIDKLLRDSMEGKE